MEIENSLIDWIESKRGDLKLEATPLGWINEWIPGGSDINLKIEVEGKEFVGRGTSGSQQLSFVKAFAEAYERVVAYSNNLRSSNGVAAHTEIEKAQLSAMREMIERDRYFNHHYLELPSKVIPNDHSELQGAQTLFSKIESLNLNIEYRELEPFLQFRTVFVRLTGHNYKISFGSYIGLCSHLDFGSAVRHATYEAVRKAAFFIYNEGAPTMSLEEFLSTEVPHINDHGLLGRDLNYSQSLNYPVTDEFTERFTEEFPLESFEFFQLNPQNQILLDCPLKVVVCRNDNLTQLVIREENLETLRGIRQKQPIQQPHIMS